MSFACFTLKCNNFHNTIYHAQPKIKEKFTSPIGIIAIISALHLYRAQSGTYSTATACASINACARAYVSVRVREGMYM